MKTLLSRRMSILLIGVPSLLCVLGCSQHATEVGSQQEQTLIGEAIRSHEDCFAVISNSQASLDQVDLAIAKLAEFAEVKEAPDFWVKIVDDPGFSIDHRGRCVLHYFLRHVKTPIPVTRLGELPGIRKWFRKETIAYALGGRSPVDAEIAQRQGHDMLKFVPDFLKGRPVGHFQSWPPIGAICIKVSHRVLIDQFLQFIQGERSNAKLVVERIGQPRHNTNGECLHLGER